MHIIYYACNEIVVVNKIFYSIFLLWLYVLLATDYVIVFRTLINLSIT